MPNQLYSLSQSRWLKSSFLGLFTLTAVAVGYLSHEAFTYQYFVDTKAGDLMSVWIVPVILFFIVALRNRLGLQWVYLFVAGLNVYSLATNEGIDSASASQGDLIGMSILLMIPVLVVLFAYWRDTRQGLYMLTGGVTSAVFGFYLGSVPHIFLGIIMVLTAFLLEVIRGGDFGISRFSAEESDPPMVKQRNSQAVAGDVSSGSKSSGLEFPAQRPRYTFANVDGMADLKASLLEAANEALSKKPDSRNGILLSGPPGNGKSFIAEALAGELGIKLIHLSFGSLASSWINQTTEKLVTLFSDASSQGQVMLFLDEIDALLVDRSKVHNADSETARTVSVFLAEVDKLRRFPVILVGATNHINRLDPAAIREGRFDVKIDMPPPDKDARVGIFERFLMKLHKVKVNDAVRELMGRILGRMDGFSVSRIKALADEFGRQACKHKLPLTYDNVLSALRTVQGKQSFEQEKFPSLSDLVLAPSTEARAKKLISLVINPIETEDVFGSVPRGALLYGPPGTGKTTLAKAIAKETGWTLIQSSGHKLLNDTDEIRSVLDKARDLKPSIVFIDEADDVLAERVYSGNAALTNEILTAMSGNSYGLTDVLFIGATNHPDALDTASIRGGRLAFHIEVGLPGPNEALRIIEGWFKRKGMSSNDPEFDMDGFLAEHAERSPADILHQLDEWANDRAAKLLSARRETRDAIDSNSVRRAR